MVVSEINLVSFNCRGLCGRHKRRDVLNMFRNSPHDIICLQDIHVSKNDVSMFLSQWRGIGYFSCFNRLSRGVCILFKRSFQFTLLSEHRDENGNLLIIGFEHQGTSYTICNVYGPNQDEPSFFEKIEDCIDSSETDHVILCGDFNFVMDQDRDTLNYLEEHNKRAKETFKRFVVRKQLMDVWRLMNPDKKQFTWTKLTPLKQSRLDMIFVDAECFESALHCDILPGYRPDHERVCISLKNTSQDRGPGLWKFNNALLKEKEYSDLVKNIIKEQAQRYAAPVYNEHFFSSENFSESLELTINDTLFFETLLMTIREQTIYFSKQRASRLRQCEHEIMQKLESLASVTTERVLNAQETQRLKDELEEIRRPKIDGLLVRSRTVWQEEGERPSKLFLSLERSHCARKNVTYIEHNGQKISNRNEIIKLFTKHLQERYSSTQSCELEALENVELRTLSQEDFDMLEKPVTLDEMLAALKNMKGGKAPGSDGFSVEFFKFFWGDLKFFQLRSLNYCINHSKLSEQMKTGIITLIPKSSTRKHSLNGWRAISLLNVNFKICSTIIARRMQQVIPSLVSSSQTAYVKNRFIGENTRLTFDVIDYCNKHNVPGIVIAADFEAAFETVDWEFLRNVLKRMGFGMKFLQLIELFYLNQCNFSRILLNGYLGEKIFIRRGIRQGDPTSGYLFILAVEVLSKVILHSEKFVGIRISDNIEVRLSQYADDSLLFVNGSTEDVKGVVDELSAFCRMSGLRLNASKTKCLAIGPDHAIMEGVNLDPLGLSWVEELTVLGIKFANNNINITDMNLKEKLPLIYAEIKKWNKRTITLMGKIVVIKSLLLSKIVHILTSLPNPSEHMIKQIEEIFWKFLWHGKKDRIKRKKIVQSIKDGGLQMLELKSFIIGLKINWIKRLRTSGATWSAFATEVIIPSFDSLILHGSAQLKKDSERIHNDFWRGVMKAWAHFNEMYELETEHIFAECIWFSEVTKYRYSIVRQWDDSGIRFIYDLWNNVTRKWYTREELQLKYNIQMNFLDYEMLIRSLPRELSKCNLDTSKSIPILPNKIRLILDPNLSKTCRRTLVRTMKDKPGAVSKIAQKWLRDTGNYEISSTAAVFKSIGAPSIRMFYYKLCNRILTTNHFLKIIGVLDIDSCTFCADAPETIIHLFWECSHTNQLYKKAKEYLSRSYQIELTLNINEWFFPTVGSELDIMMKTLLKFVIYRARFLQAKPDIHHFINTLQIQLDVERLASKMKGTSDKFERKWGAIGASRKIKPFGEINDMVGT